MLTLIRRVRRRNRGGFSLVEVVLALGVIAFSLVAILGVLFAAFSQNRKGISDTRAAQLARMIVSTIEGQTASFSNINCFGATLNLTDASTETAPVMLYASYSSPNQPEIIATKDVNSIYGIELRFNNTPEVAPAVSLPAGTVNQLQIRVRGVSATSTDFVEFMYVVRKKG